MNRAKKSYRSMPLSFPTIFLTIFLLFCLLLFANLAIAQSAELSKKYPELQKLQDAGGSVIGELDYNLDPGWWHWTLSCDRAKWVSYGDSWSSCDQQKHDFESVVEPTLSKTTEIVVPANGKIVLFIELRMNEGYHKEPAVSFTLQKKDGSSGTIGSPTLSRVSHATGKKIESAPPKPLNRNAVEKGDKIIIKIGASWYLVSYRSAIPAQGARVQVFFIPDVPEVTDSDGDGVPDDIDECHGTPAGVAVDNRGCPKYLDPESNRIVDVITPLNGQIYGVVRTAGDVGRLTSEPWLSDPTTDREKIEARIAVIEGLPPEERKKRIYRDELAQLYAQLYILNRHEELDGMLVGGLITVTDKSMGYYTPTALVWGISTGLTTLIMGDFEDGMNRLIGAIPWKNFGTAYSALLELSNLLPDYHKGGYIPNPDVPDDWQPPRTNPNDPVAVMLPPT